MSDYSYNHFISALSKNINLFYTHIYAFKSFFNNLTCLFLNLEQIFSVKKMNFNWKNTFFWKFAGFLIYLINSVLFLISFKHHYTKILYTICFFRKIILNAFWCFLFTVYYWPTFHLNSWFSREIMGLFI